MSLHITPYAEGFSTAGVRTLEWLLTSVAVTVDFQAAGPRKGLVTCCADISILRLRV